VSGLERELIDRLRSRFPNTADGLGIGDDAAIINGTGPLVVTTDMLIEDVDFTADIPVKYVAGKSLAANLSDLAAMGSRPSAFLLTLGIPLDFHAQFDDFSQSLAEAASRWKVQLIGGDLSRSDRLIISITALGRFDAGARPLLRSSATAGERIYVSRPLGGAATGLKLLTDGWRILHDGRVKSPHSSTPSYADRELAASAIMRHVAPEPETDLGPALALIPEVGACIDISDGLSSDLLRICEASGVGALVDWDHLPLLPDLPASAGSFGIAIEDVLLHGGEEFALLFTSTLREADLSSRLGRPVYAIGAVRADRGMILLRNGREEELREKGFDHFSVTGDERV